MRRWRVERTPRTAHRPSPVPPAGVSALMPHPSQGAERLTERHAARGVGNSSKWGLRVLVIGGLAGAAWLLTGAAAHAADRVPAPEANLLGASSLAGSVLHGDDAAPVVTRVLQAAAWPPESSHHAHEQHKLGSVVRIPDLLQEPVVGVVSEVTNVTRAVRDLAAPIRLTGGPPDSAIRGVVPPRVGSATRVLRPAADVVPSAAMSQPVAAVGSTAPHEKPRNVAAVAVPGSPKGVRNSAGAAHWRLGVTHRHHTAVEADAPEAVRAAPAGNGPAPLQGYLGVISGIPAVGSGAPTGGGSAAFLPVAVGEHAVASHRLPPVAGVEARHHDAEAPTVSPD